MTDFMRTLLKRLNWQKIPREKIKSGQCHILPDGAPQPHLVINFDKLDSPLGKNQTKCDFLFIAEGEKNHAWVVPIELKKKEPRADKVIKQLQSGARVAEKLVPSDVAVMFRPVIASGSCHRHELNTLKSQKIRFRDCSEIARRIKCGQKLKDALRQ